MKLTDHEEKFLLRALDKASAPAEAEKAAQALIASLRARGISGYDILGGTGSVDAANPMHTPRPPSTGSGRHNGNGSSTAPPPEPDRKWHFARKQRATQAPRAKTHSSKIAIFIVALAFFFICSVLAYLVFPNRVFMILMGGFGAQWLWRALWKPQPGKIGSTIAITILVLICFLLCYFLAFLVSHNGIGSIIMSGLAACWFWRGLRRVNFLGN